MSNNCLFCQIIKDEINENIDTSNWKDDFKPTEYEFTDIITPEPLQSPKNHVKWVDLGEATNLPRKTGNILTRVDGEGRGGAAFPTGIKWSCLVGSPGPTKYILCNCEEGDPGAYNDKGILESAPHTLIEGLTIAGYATGASNGIVFIRHGHDGPIDRTEKAIEQAYEVGILGKNIFGTGFDFDVEVALTGESYVAGEETALMEAIEGNRSMPRFRPPFPAAFGVWGKPSNINNVKSLSYAPEIISRGAAWFSSIGVNRSTGTAIVCLSGNVNKPGLYEVPMGMTLGTVIDLSLIHI